MPDQKYTVTVYAAAPGTPLMDETGKQLVDKQGKPETSVPGHMFYVTSDGTNRISNGFAPVTQGNVDGPGKIYHTEEREYSNPLYSRTMEISKDQYDKLNEFGQDPKKFGFDMSYKDVRNNCVDFTWAALNHANIKQQNHADIGPPGISIRVPLPGHAEDKTSLRPAENVSDIKSIKDPVPGSPLNKEHTNPMPHQNLEQWLLSNKGLDDQSHPGNGLYTQARDQVYALDAKLGRTPDARSDNLAGAVTVAAFSAGITRIDHVTPDIKDGSTMFVAQNTSPLKTMAEVQTVQAMNTPLQQSSQQYMQIAQQQAQAPQQDQTQTQAQTQATTQQQAQPAMQIKLS